MLWQGPCSTVSNVSSPLWWASHHRIKDGPIHSVRPKQRDEVEWAAFEGASPPKRSSDENVGRLSWLYMYIGEAQAFPVIAERGVVPMLLVASGNSKTRVGSSKPSDLHLHLLELELTLGGLVSRRHQ